MRAERSLPATYHLKKCLTECSKNSCLRTLFCIGNVKKTTKERQREMKDTMKEMDEMALKDARIQELWRAVRTYVTSLRGTMRMMKFAGQDPSKLITKPPKKKGKGVENPFEEKELPFIVIKPDSRPKIAWDLFVFTVFTTLLILFPISFAYEKDLDTVNMGFIKFLDWVMVFDIAFTLVTTHRMSNNRY